MTRRLSDRLAGAIVLALAVWYHRTAEGFSESFGDPVGPSAFPQMIAVPTGALALFLLVRPDPDPKWLHLPGAWRQIATLVTLLAYPTLIEPAGFPAATFLGAAALSRILGASWLGATAVGLAVGPGLWLIFDPLLGLPLPLLPKG